jgi:hypothetical protein
MPTWRRRAFSARLCSITKCKWVCSNANSVAGGYYQVAATAWIEQLLLTEGDAPSAAHG